MKNTPQKTYSVKEAKAIIRAKIEETSRELGAMIRSEQKQRAAKKSRMYA